MKIAEAPFLILLFTLSCAPAEKGIRYSISNQSNEMIQQVEFSTSEYIRTAELGNIKPGETLKGFLSMEGNQSDGTYTLSFTDADNETHLISYGYYTNGAPVDSGIRYTIFPNTTKISVWGF